MNFITYDLGTGGVKASLYDEKLNTLAKSFIEYPTYYPKNNFFEQKPSDWWNGVIQSTKVLLEKAGVPAREIACLALSGHSCVAVPVGAEKQLLTETVPIWSDTRAASQVLEFFSRVDEEKWYMTTGNGFPAACYAIFKLMWLKQEHPEVYRQIYKVVGSKDYINMMLTGEIRTDHSYASSSGVYDLMKRRMCPDLIEASELSAEMFPNIVPSHTIIGHVTPEAAAATGLEAGTAVACGGVDNACMAMGAVGAEEGAVYMSLGSSSWIPVNSTKPILDVKTKPYVFAHIDENMFTSAYSIFAGGSSYRWARETFCKDLDDKTVYQEMDQLASVSPIGSNGILFNPSLAGGTSQDKSVNIRGAFIGLHLGTTREDIIRATLEGIALNLKISYNLLIKHVSLSDHMLFCGGGSKSRVWMQMFADIFGIEIIKTNIDQDAASLGAAAICARAMNLWSDYAPLPALHAVELRCLPDPENNKKYEKIFPVFKHICDAVADLGDFMVYASKKAGNYPAS